MALWSAWRRLRATGAAPSSLFGDLLDDAAAWDLDEAVTVFGETIEARLKETVPKMVPTLRDPGPRRTYVQVPVHTLAELLGMAGDDPTDLGIGDAEVEGLVAEWESGVVDWAAFGADDGDDG